MQNKINDGSEDLYYEDLVILEAKADKAREVAIKLLTNLDFGFISKITDLPIEEIQELTKNI
jgi:hypothetical protein